MKTITFNPELYKLVPIIADDDMVSTAAENGNMFRAEAARAVEAAIAIVPDTLPGVVEHSGEPKCYMRADEDGDILWSEDCCSPDPIDAYGDDEISLPLFTHPPAQPDTEAATGPSNTMIGVAQRNLRAFLSKASFALNVDREAALTCVDVLAQAITAQPAPANSIAIVQAALEAAADKADEWTMDYVIEDSAPIKCGDTIRAIDPQTVIDAATKGQQ